MMRYDCHVEVFDPVVESSSHGQCGASQSVRKLKNYLVSQKLRPVLVQPRQYGDVHRCLINAIAALGTDARAVAALTTFSRAKEIDELDRVGVRGTRLTVESIDIPSLLDQIYAIDQTIPSTWHIELLAPWRRVIGLGASLAQINRNFVVHCHLTDFNLQEGADLDRLWWWNDMGNLYIKLLGEFPQGELIAGRGVFALSRLMERASDRTIWGSGWPSVPLMHESMESLRFDGISLYSREFETNARDLYKFDC